MLDAVDTTMSDALVGRVLDGRYRVEARIARGGMATVYRALDTRLDRVVALKVMHQLFAENDQFVARTRTSSRSMTRATTAATCSSRWSTSRAAPCATS
jgi:serine/threonine-protein kinase